PALEQAQEAIFVRLRTLPTMTPIEARDAVADAARQLMALRKTYPQPRATFEDFMNHVRHALDLVGPEHVGIGADWDGGGGVTGVEDNTGRSEITERPGEGGLTQAQVGQFSGGNALRVLGKG